MECSFQVNIFAQFMIMKKIDDTKICTIEKVDVGCTALGLRVITNKTADRDKNMREKQVCDDLITDQK